MEKKIDIRKLLTARHYSEKYGIVKETVFYRIHSGKLPYVKIDGVYFIIDEENKKEKEDK